eukprot:scaffold271084_cov21-Tisochrysis_lutea.AAC.1
MRRASEWEKASSCMTWRDCKHVGTDDVVALIAYEMGNLQKGSTLLSALGCDGSDLGMAVISEWQRVARLQWELAGLGCNGVSGWVKGLG